MSVAKAEKINVKYHFDSIDILRGFAAISVVVYHVIEHFICHHFLPADLFFGSDLVGWALTCFL